MFETVNDPIDVLSACTDGNVEPLRFRWKGRVIRVKKITGRWSRREGQSLLRFFSIQGASEDSYELYYDPRGPRWILSRAWTRNDT